MESLTRTDASQNKRGGDETEDRYEGDLGPDGRDESEHSRTRFWRDTARLAYSLGLSPYQFWKEYSYNELLAKLHFDRQRHEHEIDMLKSAAWLNSQAIGNVLNGLFGEKTQTFDEFFGKKQTRNVMTHDELKAKLKEHDLILE